MPRPKLWKLSFTTLVTVQNVLAFSLEKEGRVAGHHPGEEPRSSHDQNLLVQGLPAGHVPVHEDLRGQLGAGAGDGVCLLLRGAAMGGRLGGADASFPMGQGNPGAGPVPAFTAVVSCRVQTPR